MRKSVDRPIKQEITQKSRAKTLKQACFGALIGAILILNASSVCAYTDNDLANAIYRAEGGYKARYLYGIVSVHYKNEAEARQICLNTIRNQRKRHAVHDCGKDFLTCLRDRYCPLQAKNDPQGLNSNWLRNVRYFLERGVK